MSGLLSERNKGGQSSMTPMLLIMGLMFMGLTLLTPPPPEEAAETETETEAASTSTSAAATDTGAEAVAVVEAQPDAWIGNENYRMSITNTGALMSSLEVLSPERQQPREDLAQVFPNAEMQVHPLRVRVLGLPDLVSESMFSLDAASLTQAQAAAGGEPSIDDELTYSWRSPDGSIEVRKVFGALEGANFGSSFRVEIENLSGSLRRFDGLELAMGSDFDPEAKGSMLNPGASFLEVLCHDGDSTEREPAHKLEADEPERFAGSVAFAGIGERYFMNALVAPADNAPAACELRRLPGNAVESVMISNAFEVEAGQTLSLDYRLFHGPKNAEYLNQVDERLTDSFDFGFFSFLALPLRWLLLFFQGLVGNWGIAIILLTFTIKALLLPVTQKSFSSMEKMRVLQPQMEALNKKYENDPMKKAEEQMKLFKEHGTSPLGGCLPMLLQMPIYFALYRCVWGSTELYNAPFYGWIQDLSSSDPYFILPAVMVITMVLQQKLMPQPANANPQMMVMQKVMPIMFGAMMIFLPSGLVLYICVNMFLSIAQQVFIRKRMAAKAQ